MEPRKKLSDILRQSGQYEHLKKAWEKTIPADDLTPLPAGEYLCRVIDGKSFEAKVKGTPGHKFTFEVIEGDYADRRIWHDVWITEAALPLTMRDLAKLGIESLDQLDTPLPPRIIIKVKLILRKDDDGKEYNRVKSFEFVEIEKGDAFEPTGPAQSTEAPADALFEPDTKASLPEPRFKGATRKGDKQ